MTIPLLSNKSRRHVEHALATSYQLEDPLEKNRIGFSFFTGSTCTKRVLISIDGQTDGPRILSAAPFPTEMSQWEGSFESQLVFFRLSLSILTFFSLLPETASIVMKHTHHRWHPSCEILNPACGGDTFIFFSYLNLLMVTEGEYIFHRQGLKTNKIKIIFPIIIFTYLLQGYYVMKLDFILFFKQTISN